MSAQIRSIVIASVLAAFGASSAMAAGVDDAAFQAVLTASVKGNRVNYNAVEKHQDKLKGYVAQVGSADVSKLGKKAKLAFYVNAYNALVLNAVLANKRPKSVLDVKGFFDGAKVKVAGKEMTLNDLENNHIRSAGDPRIHFVVNCASYDCPPLAKKVYSAKTIDGSLDRQAKAYLKGKDQVVVDDKAKTIKVVQIFEWFQKDFGGEQGVRDFIAKYRPDMAKKVQDKSYKLTYRKYDWRLNAAK